MDAIRNYRKKWTRKENQLLIELLLKGKSCVEIAKVLDRNNNGIYLRAYSLRAKGIVSFDKRKFLNGFKPAIVNRNQKREDKLLNKDNSYETFQTIDNNNTFWTEDEDVILNTLYNPQNRYKSLQEVANRLGRSFTAVRVRAQKKGLFNKKDKNFKKITFKKEEVEAEKKLTKLAKEDEKSWNRFWEEKLRREMLELSTSENVKIKWINFWQNIIMTVLLIAGVLGVIYLIGA